MVYWAGEDVHYALPHCDFCGRRFSETELGVSLKFNITAPLPRNEKSLDTHEGHICEICDDISESMGITPTNATIFLR